MYVLHRGVNLVPFLEFIGLPDWIVGILRDSQGGYALTAYAMYKVYKHQLQQRVKLNLLLSLIITVL